MIWTERNGGHVSLAGRAFSSDSVACRSVLCTAHCPASKTASQSRLSTENMGAVSSVCQLCDLGKVIAPLEVGGESLLRKQTQAGQRR